MSQEVAKYIYSRVRAEGVTKAGACALLGNIQKESNFIPNNVEDGRGWTDDAYTAAVDNGTYSRFGDDGIGYGIAQWTYWSRKGKYLEYFRAKGKSIADLETQVDFLIKEMKEDYPTVWQLLTTSNDLYTCTFKLLYQWENPYEKTQNLIDRYQFAQTWYSQNLSETAASPTSGGTAKMTTEDAIKKVLDLAREEIGYHEKASNSQLDDKTANSGSGNWTKYARDLGNISNFYNGNKNGYAWCDVFYDWLFVKSFGAETGRQMLCQPTGSAGAGCLYSAQYYKSAGRWVNLPQPGDQIFFTYAAGEVSHTGIVESVSGGSVVTIEGNTSEQVARRTYSVSSSSIYGYGRPKWELATGEGAATVSTGLSSGDRILKKGTTGDDVKELQNNLIKLGYDLGTWGADGDFGVATDEAVKKFQTDHGLLADGEAGDDTRAALKKALASGTTVTASPNKASAGSSNAAVTTDISNKTIAKTKLKVGDKVQFTGHKYYTLSNGLVGFNCKPGQVLIVKVSKAAKHPYCVYKTEDSASTAHGWVDAQDLSLNS